MLRLSIHITRPPGTPVLSEHHFLNNFSFLTFFFIFIISLSGLVKNVVSKDN